MKYRWLIVAVLFAASVAAFGKEAEPLADDPALEARTTEVASEYRCPVCQNMTIADSQAGVSVDLKNEIRKQLQQGASEDQIKQYMLQRYGDFVLYNPPVKMTTWLLWFGPFLLMLSGLVVLFYTLAKRNRIMRSPPIESPSALNPETFSSDPNPRL